MAQNLMQKTPRWDHIATAKTYNNLLARRSLLESPARKTLADDIAAVAHFQEAAERVRNSFAALVGEEGDDANWQSSTCAASGSLEVSRQCMLIIACCNCVEDFSRDAKGRAMAETLLKKGSHIPEALRKKLSTLALA